MSKIKTFKEQYQNYLWNMHCNGDIFAEYWRPFTYEEWIKNGKPIDDGGVKLDDNTEHLTTFRYKSKRYY
jgi:hypothetical protein